MIVPSPPWELIEARFDRHVATARSELRFHGPRLPRHLARLLFWSPRGLYRTLRPLVVWVAYVDGYTAARTVTSRAGADGRGVSSVRDLWRDYRRWVMIRAALLSAALVGLVVGVVSTANPTDGSTPAWALWLVVAFGVVGLGWKGRPQGAMLGRANPGQMAPRVTPQIVVGALRDVGITRVTKAMKVAADEGLPEVHFVTDPTHTSTGVEISFDMPGGVPSVALFRKRADLAVGLRRRKDCVWPMPDVDVHEGRVRLVVLDEPMGKDREVPWPLADVDPSFDIFDDKVPLGEDAAQRPVSMSLAYRSGMIGSIPRMGKSFTLRLMLASALQDDRVELHLYALRATGEFDALRELCAAYRSGDRPDDLKALVADLRHIQAEVRRRADVIQALPDHLTEESKVTSHLASRKDLGLHPIIFCIDEVQLAVLSVHGAEVVAALHEIGSIGQAVGVWLWFSTQKPSTDFLPSGIRDNTGNRIALAMQTQQGNDMVLGQGMHAAGVKATDFKADDVGMAIVVSDGEPQVAKIYYAEASTVRAKVSRLKARRELAGGVLVGLAGGEELPSHIVADDNVEDSFLDDIINNWPVGDDQARTSEIVDALKEADSVLYEDMTPQRLTVRLKAYGVNGSINVPRDGVNGRGHSRQKLIRALANLPEGK